MTARDRWRALPREVRAMVVGGLSTKAFTFDCADPVHRKTMRAAFYAASVLLRQAARKERG